MSTGSIFKEYIKPAISMILTGLIFFGWYTYQQEKEADKAAKANLFGKHDTEKQRQLDEANAKLNYVTDRKNYWQDKYLDLLEQKADK